MLKKIGFSLIMMLSVFFSTTIFAFPLSIQPTTVSPSGPGVVNFSTVLDNNPLDDMAGDSFVVNQKYMITCTLTNKSTSVIPLSIGRYDLSDFYQNAELAVSSVNNYSQLLKLPSGSYELTVHGFYNSYKGTIPHGIDIANYSAASPIYISNCQAQIGN